VQGVTPAAFSVKDVRWIPGSLEAFIHGRQSMKGNNLMRLELCWGLEGDTGRLKYQMFAARYWCFEGGDLQIVPNGVFLGFLS
jgi:hypothetical protein